VWKRYWAAVASLSAVVTVIVAAYQFHVVWLAVSVLLLGVPIATLPRLVRWMRMVLKCYRDNPVLLARIAALENDDKEHEVRYELTTKQHQAEVKAAVLRGRRQAKGAVLGILADTPVIVSISVREGQLVVCGRVAEGQRAPDRGARFSVYPEGQDDNPLGTLEVTKSKDLFVWLEPTAGEGTPYLEGLATRAESDTSPPEAISLASYSLGVETENE